MKRAWCVVGCLAICAMIFLPITAQAAFHLWDISEIYSNSSGSVQFIELLTGSFGQSFTSGTQITSNSHTFTFPSNITTPPDTNGRHLLLATLGFGLLGRSARQLDRRARGGNRLAPRQTDLAAMGGRARSLLAGLSEGNADAAGASAV
jgi:hypothetical protein